MSTLHVTNGDAVLALFKKAGMHGKHLAWRDALYDGPVPAGLALEACSDLRARYMSERGYGNPIRLIHEFRRRDALLREAGTFDEVVLWFEHDLYDQLQLLQVLVALDELQLDPGRVTVVQSDRYLGTMTADELSALLPRRRSATPAIFKSAGRAWKRFTSDSPDDLYAGAEADAIGLPFLRAALLRLCEEYPSTRDGLSRSQRQALQAVAQGPARAQELYRRAQDREEASFMSDGAFARMLAGLCGDAPLVEEEGDVLVPSTLGRRILAGDGDWLDAHRIDRWIGGVHLFAANVSRWDDDAGFFA